MDDIDDINYKKKYIFDNISLIDEHNKIFNFIYFYKITHSTNSNGFFVNISKLSEDLINKLYKLIFDIIENNFDFNYKEKEEIMNYVNNSKKTIIKKNKCKNIDIELSNFSLFNKELIKKSKNYNFD